MMFGIKVGLVLLFGSLILLSGAVIALCAITTNNQMIGSLGLGMIVSGWTILDPDGTYNTISKWIKQLRKRQNPIT